MKTYQNYAQVEDAIGNAILKLNTEDINGYRKYCGLQDLHSLSMRGTIAQCGYIFSHLDALIGYCTRKGRTYDEIKKKHINAHI